MISDDAEMARHFRETEAAADAAIREARRQPLKRPIRNLGQVAGLILAHAVDEDNAYDERVMMRAPSECDGLIRRSALKQARRLRRRIHALTGVPGREVMRQLERRVSAGWLHRTGLAHHAFEVFYGAERQ